ncbi:regulatory protein RecX [Rhizobium sp. RU36D]|uniref:regulatory protein RecX n=1 Tax=Rhizobium sp. RU36D TaxID=1907415 RepID=UPI0009D8FC84|nr:regulatory protein RecX [Rhizobium sp. RU36D]SMC67983.1 regulatory protein [Rhizobium sp. RU36D]
MIPPDDENPDVLPTPRMLAWARNSAAYRLSRKMMTERELATAIERKARQKFEGISASQLAALSAAAIDFGRQMLVLDDNTYAEVKVRSAVSSGRSKRVIAQKLAQKGVARDIVEEKLADTDDLRAALIFARKRAFGPFARKVVDDISRNKALAAFARQGFGFSLGARVMAMDLEEAQAVLEETGGSGGWF